MVPAGFMYRCAMAVPLWPSGLPDCGRVGAVFACGAALPRAPSKLEPSRRILVRTYVMRPQRILVAEGFGRRRSALRPPHACRRPCGKTELTNPMGRSCTCVVCSASMDALHAGPAPRADARPTPRVAVRPLPHTALSLLASQPRPNARARAWAMPSSLSATVQLLQLCSAALRLHRRIGFTVMPRYTIPTS